MPTLLSVAARRSMHLPQEPLARLLRLACNAVVAEVERKIQLRRGAETDDEPSCALLRRVPAAVAASLLPGVVRLVVRFDDVEHLFVGNEAFGEPTGDHAVMVLSRA